MTMASSVVRSTWRRAYWTTAPGPGSRLILVSPSSTNRPPDAATCLATMNRAPAVPMKVSRTTASCLGDLRERHLRLLAEVAVVELRDPSQGVDLVHRLVVADAHDAREAQRVAAQVPARMLDGVERHLEHDLGPDHASIPLVLHRHGEEFLGVLGDLGVGQPGIRLADVDQPRGARVLDGERVVRQHAAPFTVTPLDRRDDDVERRERPLQLQPREPTPPWRVRAQRILHHQAFVAALASLRKDAVEVLRIGRLLQSRQQVWRLETQPFEELAPLRQRLVEQRASVEG